MKLADCREAYQYNSSQVSSNVRQLGFAALAAIWVFRTTSTGEAIGLPLLLWWVGGLSIGAMFFDFVQYLWNTAAWGAFHRKQEVAGTAEDTDFLAPVWMNWPGIAFFVVKVCCTVLSYIVLIVFLFGKIQLGMKA